MNMEVRMSKYDPLARFLAVQETDSVTLGFDRVSEILGTNLPRSAFDYRPWWANRHDGNDAQNAGWQSVGWESKDVDMQRKLVTFFRQKKCDRGYKDVISAKPLSIGEAKAGLSANFGVPAEAIEIIIKG